MRVLNAVGVGMLALLAAGCGVREAAQRQKAENDLKQIGLMYHNYADKHLKGPAKVEDLREFSADYAQAYEALKAGQYTLVLNGTTIPLMLQGASNTVLAYESDTPTKGGAVVMGDASVKRMTAEEFKKAPKANGQ